MIFIVFFLLKMMKGTPDRLKSAFHVGYNMLLNLLRVEDANPEYVIERSFFQFQSTRTAPELQEEAENLKSKITEVSSQISNTELVCFSSIRIFILISWFMIYFLLS